MNAEMWITNEVKVEVELDRVPLVSFVIISDDHNYTIVYWYWDISKCVKMIVKTNYVYYYESELHLLLWKWVTFIIIESNLRLLL